LFIHTPTGILKGLETVNRILLCSILLVLALNLRAQEVAHRIVFQVPGTTPAPVPVPTRLGTSRAPDGSTLGVNNEYLTRDGKPWIPVMGEFHFSRYPESYWEEEILKMKASGVQVVATYIFWIHHEEIEGQFDWSGQRNLRKFAQLCAKHGMLLYPRIGPWAHGEARNGGLPDWVMRKGPVRGNDPVYLAEVREYYAQIGLQLQGLLWKDGGPVIGIQIENEYTLKGPGQGQEHLAVLKQMAIESGLDVPLYTVTGWDGATVSEELFLPVYGGYPDAPWGESAEVLPPSEVYAFRFKSRVASDMGGTDGPVVASGGHDSPARRSVPFLTAEVGGGIEDTYHRRPVLAADDVPAMIPVMLGSGVNLLGYYMYQGGENPDGKLTTLEESQRTGYPNDLPVKSYDFQAPLGEFGEMTPHLRKLKMIHYFLHDFGAELAPAAVVEPDLGPAGPTDLSVPRASARFNGDSGFIFVNNYIREHAMPAWPATQFELKFSGKTLLVPETPFTVPANAYFFWPVNIDLDGILLKYATAQPILKTQTGDDTCLFFRAIPGVPVEFAFLEESRSALAGVRGRLTADDGILRVRDVEPGRGVALTVHGKNGTTRIIVLGEKDAENLWRVNLDGEDQLLLTDAQVFSDGRRLILRQVGNTVFDVEVFPAGPMKAGDDSVSQQAGKSSGLFEQLVFKVRDRKVAVEWSQTKGFARAPQPLLGPTFPWRKSRVAMAPEPDSFDQAADWRITVPSGAMNGLSDLLLDIRYQGDQARLLSGDRLLTDNFYNGLAWQIGLKRFLSDESGSVFDLQVMPLASGARIFFEPGMAPRFDEKGQAGSMQSIQVRPEYEVDLTRPPTGAQNERSR